MSSTFSNKTSIKKKKKTHRERKIMKCGGGTGGGEDETPMIHVLDVNTLSDL